MAFSDGSVLDDQPTRPRAGNTVRIRRWPVNPGIWEHPQARRAAASTTCEVLPVEPVTERVESAATFNALFTHRVRSDRPKTSMTSWSHG